MNKIVPFISSRGSKKTEDGDIIDHGDIGSLEYEVYKRGVIHIFSGKDTDKRFKKDIDSFEEELEKLDFSSLKEGYNLSMNGSGDNMNLIFTHSNGDIKLSLEAKGFPTLEKLKNILKSKKSK